MTSPTWTAKLLLFGEHAVVHGSRGLAMPWAGRFMRWMPADGDERAGYSIGLLTEFIGQLREIGFEHLDLDAAQAALDSGEWLDTDIPVGYGLGSSGAACAALAHRFAKPGAFDSDNLEQLQQRFGEMESPFHGRSSGIDPTVIYLNRALLFGGGEKPSPVDLPAPGGSISLYLIDTGIARRTGPLVEMFGQRMESDDIFTRAILAELVPANEAAIEAFLNADASSLTKAMRVLSRIQLEAMADWTPEAFHEGWKKGLDSGDFQCKICGAGGGGFIMAWTSRPESLAETFSGRRIELVYRL